MYTFVLKDKIEYEAIILTRGILESLFQNNPYFDVGIDGWHWDPSQVLDT